jgi:Ca2+:H+ antiporter
MNYNPFARQRSRYTQSDLESGSYRTRSEAQTAIEEQRRFESREAEKEFGPPRHHHTEPSAPSVPTPIQEQPEPDQTNSRSNLACLPGSSTEKDEKGGETLVEASDSTVVHLGGVTKRAKFKGIFRKEQNDELVLVDSSTDALSLEERRRKSLRRKIPVGAQLKYLLLSSWISFLLLPCIPVGFALNYVHANAIAVFCVNFVAIVPSATVLSAALNEINVRANEKVSALLNQTFG